MCSIHAPARGAVHDDERLILSAQGIYQRRVVHRPREFELRSPEFAGKPSGVRRQLPAIERQAREAVTQTQRRLRRRAEENGASVVGRQFLYRAQDRDQQVARQGLSLVQYDHRPSDIVQLAATRGARREQAFEQLHGGGDHHRRRPVLHGKAKLVPARPAIRLFLVDGGMVLEHGIVAEEITENSGGLIDDRSEGNGVDDAPHAVSPGMVEREGERGQRFAAARRNRQCEEPWRLSCLAAHRRENSLAQTIDGRVSCPFRPSGAWHCPRV